MTENLHRLQQHTLQLVQLVLHSSQIVGLAVIFAVWMECLLLGQLS